MVSTILIEDLFDLLEEFKNIFGGINLPFDDELFHCCDFYVITFIALATSVLL